jgi:hypothetical protein
LELVKPASGDHIVQEACDGVNLDGVVVKEGRMGSTSCPDWLAVFGCVLIVREEGCIIEAREAVDHEKVSISLESRQREFTDGGFGGAWSLVPLSIRSNCKKPLSA